MHLEISCNSRIIDKREWTLLKIARQGFLGNAIMLEIASQEIATVAYILKYHAILE